MATPVSTPARFKLPVQDQRVEELLLWRDPKRSGIAFGGATAVFLFLRVFHLNLLSILCGAGALLVTVMVVWSLVGKFLPKMTTPPPLPAVLTSGLSQAQLHSYADRLAPVINAGLATTGRCLGGSDLLLSGGVIAGLLFASKVVSRFSVLTLAYLPVLAAFTLPHLYEKNQDKVDSFIDSGRSQMTGLYDKHVAKLVQRIPASPSPMPAQSTSTLKME